MKRTSMVAAMVIVLAWTAPAPAQLFAKKPKVNASQRVPELILTVKTDQDERKRASAVEELRNFDTASFTEIVPVLIDVLQTDKKINVRLETLGSLTRIRPVSPAAGRAIEKAANDDESWRVRLNAKAALPKYHLAGYSSKKSEPAPAKKAVLEGPVSTKPAKTPMPTAPAATFPRPLPPGIELPSPRVEPRLESGPSLFP